MSPGGWDSIEEGLGDLPKVQLCLYPLGLRGHMNWLEFLWLLSCSGLRMFFTSNLGHELGDGFSQLGGLWFDVGCIYQ